MGAWTGTTVCGLLACAIAASPLRAEMQSRVVELDHHGIMVNITEDFDGTPTVTGQCLIPLPQNVVWAVLSGYEQLDELIPSVSLSRLAGEEDGALILHQEGRAGLWFVKRGYEVTFRVRERPMSAIDFEAVDGDFEIFTGSWRIKPMRSGTLVRHEVRIQPKFWAPKWAMRSVAGDMMMETINAIISKCFETAGSGNAGGSAGSE